MILAAMGRIKRAENSSNRVSKKNISFSVFVNLPANMS
jgi:hypothetical protein